MTVEPCSLSFCNASVGFFALIASNFSGVFGGDGVVFVAVGAERRGLVVLVLVVGAVLLFWCEVLVALATGVSLNRSRFSFSTVSSLLLSSVVMIGDGFVICECFGAKFTQSGR